MFPSATCGRGRFAFPAAFPVGIRPFRTEGHLRQGAVNEACCRVKWRLYHYTLICQFKTASSARIRQCGPGGVCSARFLCGISSCCAPFPAQPKEIGERRGSETKPQDAKLVRKPQTQGRTHAIRRPDHRIRPSGAPCPAQKHPQNARTNRGHPRKRQDQHRRA